MKTIKFLPGPRAAIGRAVGRTLTIGAMLLVTGAAFGQMPGMGGGGGGINIGGGRNHQGDDSKNQSCPPSLAAARVDTSEDARDRLEALRSKLNPSAEQIPFWTK